MGLGLAVEFTLVLFRHDGACAAQHRRAPSTGRAMIDRQKPVAKKLPFPSLVGRRAAAANEEGRNAEKRDDVARRAHFGLQSPPHRHESWRHTAEAGKQKNNCRPTGKAARF